MQNKRRYFMLRAQYSSERFLYVYVMDTKVCNSGRYYTFGDCIWRAALCSISAVRNDPRCTELSEEDAMLELI